MNRETLLLTIGIDAAVAIPNAINLRLPSWPPPRDFPVIVDANGLVVSRIGDSHWNLWPWSKSSLSISFGDGRKRKGAAPISSANADIYRMVATWWLYGPRAVREATTLKSRCNLLHPIFVLCTREGIVASDLASHPNVVDAIGGLIQPSRWGEALQLLHVLYEQRDQLGFTLLDRESLRRMEAASPDHQTRQTSYMPPRIWAHVINRLHLCLDDFHESRERIEACYRFCLDAYGHNAGSIANACQKALSNRRRPFVDPGSATGARTGMIFHGPFSDTARRFGIEELLRRWILDDSESMDGGGRSVNVLTAYFNLIRFVGLTYILSFSLMRLNEARRLRADCLEVEQDERFGAIYLLKGPTTKSVRDGDARWIASPSVKKAVEAMSCISRLRLIAACQNPRVPTLQGDEVNPPLLVRGYEPWGGAKHKDKPLSVAFNQGEFGEAIRVWPKLFDENEMRIREPDLRIARLLTPSLDAGRYFVGAIWPLSFHQLRRTGAVNMQASGLVSDASLQYQLKHATRAMSLYYGRGYSQVRLNEAAQRDYIRASYEVLSMELGSLLSDRYVSPHGDERKADILRLVDPKDNARLLSAAKSGSIAWRETLLGGCCKAGPCEFGGIDNVSRCGGGDGKSPCAHAMFDRKKSGDIVRLKKEIEVRRLNAPLGTPYRESLDAQLRATENALHAIEVGK